MYLAFLEEDKQVTHANWKSFFTSDTIKNGMTLMTS